MAAVTLMQLVSATLTLAVSQSEVAKCGAQKQDNYINFISKCGSVDDPMTYTNHNQPRNQRNGIRVLSRITIYPAL